MVQSSRISGVISLISAIKLILTELKNQSIEVVLTFSKKTP